MIDKIEIAVVLCCGSIRLPEIVSHRLIYGGVYIQGLEVDLAGYFAGIHGSSMPRDNFSKFMSFDLGYLIKHLNEEATSLVKQVMSLFAEGILHSMLSITVKRTENLE